MSPDGPICLTCERVGIRRGLCHRCYQACSTQIRAGRISWEEAEDLGLANPARKSGPWMDKFKSVAPVKSRLPQEVASPVEPEAGTDAND